MFNPLTLPPKLILRALEDLNALAEAARRLPELELEVDGVVGRLHADLGAVRGAVVPLEKHLIALRTEVEPIQQIAALRQAVQPLEEHMTALRAVIAPIEGHMVGLHQDIAPVQGLAGKLDDVRGATDQLEPMIEEMTRGMRELLVKLEEIRESIAPLGDVADNLPKFMKS